MPDRRRRGGSAKSGPHDHPVLTPKGYRMMYESPLKDDSYSMPMPCGVIPRDGGQSRGVMDHRGVDPAENPFFGKPASPGPMHNVLPAKKFPNPDVLAIDALDRPGSLGQA